MHKITAVKVNYLNIQKIHDIKQIYSQIKSNPIKYSPNYIARNLCFYTIFSTTYQIPIQCMFCSAQSIHSKLQSKPACLFACRLFNYVVHYWNRNFSKSALKFIILLFSRKLSTKTITAQKTKTFIQKCWHNFKCKIANA